MDQSDLADELKGVKGTANAALIIAQIVLDAVVANGLLTRENAIAALEHNARSIAALEAPEHIAAHDLLMARAMNMRAKKPQ